MDQEKFEALAKEINGLNVLPDLFENYISRHDLSDEADYYEITCLLEDCGAFDGEAITQSEIVDRLLASGDGLFKTASELGYTTENLTFSLLASIALTAENRENWESKQDEISNAINNIMNSND